MENDTSNINFIDAGYVSQPKITSRPTTNPSANYFKESKEILDSNISELNSTLSVRIHSQEDLHSAGLDFFSFDFLHDELKSSDEPSPYPLHLKRQDFSENKPNFTSSYFCEVENLKTMMDNEDFIENSANILMDCSNSDYVRPNCMNEFSNEGNYKTQSQNVEEVNDEPSSLLELESFSDEHNSFHFRKNKHSNLRRSFPPMSKKSLVMKSPSYQQYGRRLRVQYSPLKKKQRIFSRGSCLKSLFKSKVNLDIPVVTQASNDSLCNTSMHNSTEVKITGLPIQYSSTALNLPACIYEGNVRVSGYNSQEYYTNHDLNLQSNLNYIVPEIHTSIRTLSYPEDILNCRNHLNLSNIYDGENRAPAPLSSDLQEIRPLNYKKDEAFVRWLNNTDFKVGFIDTHCHFDFLFHKEGYRNCFQSFIRDCSESEPFPKSFEGCVAIFCNPTTFMKISWWSNILSDDMVWGAFGCHPHFANKFGTTEEDLLRYALHCKDVKAVGEIGLDYSRNNNNPADLQKEVFIKQLEIAMEYKKPLVIHCRDAFKDCFYILKEMLPKNYVIHKHCFIGDTTEAIQWMTHFPNLYLGFTCFLTRTSSTAESTRIVARNMPLNRILLETDAPYFRPHYLQKTSNRSNSHPGMAIHVAASIAELKQIPIEEVLEQTRKNTNAVYGI